MTVLTKTKYSNRWNILYALFYAYILNILCLVILQIYACNYQLQFLSLSAIILYFFYRPISIYLLSNIA